MLHEFGFKHYKKLGMAVPKSKGTRVQCRLEATIAMENRLLHHFDAAIYGPSFHFRSQSNVAGMLHCTSSLQLPNIPLFFRTAIPTSPNIFFLSRVYYKGGRESIEQCI